ncbi:hypothetical protein [Paenibacillus sp.]|uniref:hypothetical protein n=1 Tax=Paenibacillus sp. TaxID=58172 RepID=UPI0035690A7E
MNPVKTMGLEEWLGETTASRLMEELEKASQEELHDLRHAFEALMRYMESVQPMHAVEA